MVYAQAISQLTTAQSGYAGCDVYGEGDGKNESVRGNPSGAVSRAIICNKRVMFISLESKQQRCLKKYRPEID
jgi:hypothetical protein